MSRAQEHALRAQTKPTRTRTRTRKLAQEQIFRARAKRTRSRKRSRTHRSHARKAEGAYIQGLRPNGAYIQHQRPKQVYIHTFGAPLCIYTGPGRNVKSLFLD